MNTKFLAIAIAACMILAAGCSKKQAGVEPVPAQSQSAAAAPESMEKSVKPGGPTEAELSAMRAAKEVLVSDRVYFDFDKYDIKPEYRDVLKAKAEILKRYKDWNMLIEGHCDERGTEEYNLALGERRARAAYEMLVVLGVDSSRLKIVSFGEERPVGGGHNEKAWALDRRAQFVVSE